LYRGGNDHFADVIPKTTVSAMSQPPQRFILQRAEVQKIRVPDSILQAYSSVSFAELQRNGLRDYSDPTQVLEYLYLGSSFNAKDAHNLQQLQISLLINVAEEVEYTSESCNQVKIIIQDSEPLSIPSLHNIFTLIGISFSFNPTFLLY
jgi:hypothetical protein